MLSYVYIHLLLWELSIKIYICIGIYVYVVCVYLADCILKGCVWFFISPYSLFHGKYSLNSIKGQVISRTSQFPVPPFNWLWKVGKIFSLNFSLVSTLGEWTKPMPAYLKAFMQWSKLKLQAVMCHMYLRIQHIL
jgi:hypothetical protein